MKRILGHDARQSGFSLLEVLVAFAVLAIIMVLLLSITDFTGRTWRGVTEKMQAFEDARTAFDRISTLLGQATLRPYWDYDDLNNPTKYERVSELQFLSLPMQRMGLDAARFPAHGLFFQAPTGKVADGAALGDMPLLLNAYGFFVEYGPDDRPSWLPPSVTVRNRFRLKEWRVPSENFSLYAKTSGGGGRNYLGAESTGWIDLGSPEPKTLAENVIALVVHPKSTVSPTESDPLAESDSFVYNSRTDGSGPEARLMKHQLPPEVDLIMVAIDETSASRRWGNTAQAPGSPADGLFEKPADLEADLSELIDRLNKEQIKYILLRSTVKIRGARWSQSL